MNESPPLPDDASPEHHYGAWATAAFVIIFTALIAGAFLWSPQSGSDRAATDTRGGEAQPPPTGTLLLTLAAESEEGGISVYTLDVEAGELERADTLSPGMTPVQSPDNTRMALAGFTEGAMQLFVYDDTTQTWTQVTDDDVQFKREPQFSPDGTELVYIARDTQAVDADPDSWDVYVTDMNGNEQRIGTGYAPHFSPDDTQILALKGDGLYLLSADGQSEPQKVFDVGEGGASTRMKLAVSDDKRSIFWSNPAGAGSSHVLHGTIESWRPFQLHFDRIERDRASTYAAFSPDSNYAAALDAQENGTIAVTITNTETLERTQVAEIPARYAPEFIWLTDWIR